jgi:hypothetical protein
MQVTNGPGAVSHDEPHRGLPRRRGPGAGWVLKLAAARPAKEPLTPVTARSLGWSGCLVLRSSKAIHEDPSLVAWGWWWAAPHPRPGTRI